ncbi:unnamed protein product [Bursaphelenchus okinawaensis]|uniref:7TM_GPCR_Srx domain-containing protein n=1 Tax=Bursaphelenchus okinawaensis TaxID=465554 RepID=A0A811LLW1_9BILA|nr:unnamed protein product [Bursaphelenchus okinawaensis]CAG9124838.1 unnamed protein product [Bursaphelenchus okinawaensis]
MPPQNKLCVKRSKFCNGTIFFTSPRYWKLMCYKILFCMSITDILQLQSHFFTGVLCFFTLEPSFWIGKVIAAIGNSAWSAMIAQTLMLALNRWNVLVRNSQQTNEETKRSFIIVTGIGNAGWSAIIPQILMLALNRWNVLVRNIPNERYEKTHSFILNQMSPGVCLTKAFLVQKTSLLKATRNAWREYKILIQGVAVFLYAVVETILWHYSDILLPNFLIGEYTSPAINIGWIFFCGMTPIMNLVMNSDLRERLRRIFTKHRDKAGTKVFYASKRYWKIMCYKILLCMSITDIIQLFGHVYTGYLAISKEATWYWVEVIIGGLANAGHSVMLSQTMMLAFNRWSVLVRKEQRSEDDTKRAFIIFVIITYAYGGLFVITYFTPYCNLTYYADGYYWAYTNDSYSQIVAKVELYTAIAIMTTTLLLYVWIVVSLIMQKTNLSQSSKNAWQEYKILIQGIFLFVYAMIEIIGWHYGDIILPAALIGQYTNPVFNIVWIGFCGLTPIMNLVTNRDLRKTVLSHLTGKFDVTTVTKMQESSHTRTYNNKL